MYLQKSIAKKHCKMYPNVHITSSARRLLSIQDRLIGSMRT